MMVCIYDVRKQISSQKLCVSMSKDISGYMFVSDRSKTHRDLTGHVMY